MTTEEKLHLLEDVFEMEEGTLSAEVALNEIEEYDSMAKLSLIVMCDDEFGKKLTGEQILKFQTIQDILDFME